MVVGGQDSALALGPFPSVPGLCLIKFVNRAVTDKSMGTLRGTLGGFSSKGVSAKKVIQCHCCRSHPLVTLRLSRCSSEVASPTEMGRRLDVLCSYDSRLNLRRKAECPLRSEHVKNRVRSFRCIKIFAEPPE